MNLNNESGNIAKSGAKVRIILVNSNAFLRNGKYDNLMGSDHLQNGLLNRQ